jgi:hypothetical protein
VQGNLAISYAKLGRDDDVLRMRRDVYSGWLKLEGREHELTLVAANNYASTLIHLKRPQEAKGLLRRLLPVAQRVLGESNGSTLKMRTFYAASLFENPDATLDDLREVVETFEDAARIARRVFGGAHPLVSTIEHNLRISRTARDAREAGKSVVFAEPT